MMVMRPAMRRHLLRQPREEVPVCSSSWRAAQRTQHASARIAVQNGAMGMGLGVVTVGFLLLALLAAVAILVAVAAPNVRRARHGEQTPLRTQRHSSRTRHDA